MLLANFAKKIQKSPILLTHSNRDKFAQLATLMLLANFSHTKNKQQENLEAALSAYKKWYHIGLPLVN